MAEAGKKNVFLRLYDRMMDYVLGLLTKPIAHYTLLIPNDMAALKRHIRKGDVILVEGNERVSECIKYLTQSCWSHSAIYVGDEPVRRDPACKAGLVEQFGDDWEFLVVEALVEKGVVLSPVTKYGQFNIRICRPFNISSDDLAEVMDEVLRSVGETYDIRNIIDLMRYFLPVTLVPARWRRQALEFGSGEPTKVMCSSLLAGAFHRVRFPIMPRYEPLPDGAVAAVPARRRLWPIGGREAGAFRLGAFKMISPTLVTPRDFDLSPYFEIVKFNMIQGARFDYRKIRWAEDVPPAPQIKKGA